MRFSYKQLCFVLGICLALFPCKKGGDDSGSGTATVKDITLMLNTQEQAIERYENSWIQYHDSLHAAFDMGQWLLDQTPVERVYLLDDEHIDIRYKSGLWSTINLHRSSALGLHLTRGGGGQYRQGSIKTYTLGGGHGQQPLTQSIGNKKVMVFAPYESDFYAGGYPFVPLFAKSKTPLDVTVVSNNAATFSVIKTFKDYGFIILDTHGEYDGAFHFFAGVQEFDQPGLAKLKSWKEEDVAKYIAASGNELLELILSGKVYLSTDANIPSQLHTIGSATTHISLCLTQKYIRDIPDKLQSAVVFGNHCFSGGTGLVRFEGDNNNLGNLQDAWTAAGAVAYYGYAFKDGYSVQVANDFCVRMEDSLITRLVVNGDSTGTAHLAGGVTEQFYEAERRNRSVTTVEMMTKQAWNDYIRKLPSVIRENFYLTLFHSPEYTYGCGTFKDPRDGEVYKLACIGSQTWFAENLRYNASGSVIYPGANPSIYGRMYNYNTMSAGATPVAASAKGFQGVCPKGWHIPARDEFNAMLAYLAKSNPSQLGNQLKAKSPLWLNDAGLTLATRDKSGFAAMPGGQYDPPGFDDLGKTGIYWLASPYYKTSGSSQQYIGAVILTSDADTVDYDEALYDQLTDHLSCRCLQD